MCYEYKYIYMLNHLFLYTKTMIDTDQFIEDLIIKAIPDVDEQGLEMMIEETKPVLYDRVITHIVEQIDEKDWEKFFDMIEEKWITPKVADYLKSKIPNFPEFLQKTYDDFETMYLKEFRNFEEENKDKEETDELD